MGTRTVLVFSEKDDENLYYGIPIYKHFDGYPSNILHLLRQYVWVNEGRLKLKDISYFSAGFLRYVENYGHNPQIPDEYLQRDEAEGGDKFFLLDPYTGYGLLESQIEPNILDGWEDYYYKITPEKIYVFDSNKKKMTEITIEELLEMPDNRDYFEALEKEIYDGFYGEGKW